MSRGLSRNTGDLLVYRSYFLPMMAWQKTTVCQACGAVLSRDGKYPKIPGPAGPDPGESYTKAFPHIRRTGPGSDPPVSGPSDLDREVLKASATECQRLDLPIRIVRSSKDCALIWPGCVGAHSVRPRAADSRPYGSGHDKSCPYGAARWGSGPCLGAGFGTAFPIRKPRR